MCTGDLNSIIYCKLLTVCSIYFNKTTKNSIPIELISPSSWKKGSQSRVHPHDQTVFAMNFHAFNILGK